MAITNNNQYVMASKDQVLTSTQKQQAQTNLGTSNVEHISPVYHWLQVYSSTNSILTFHVLNNNPADINDASTLIECFMNAYGNLSLIGIGAEEHQNLSGGTGKCIGVVGFDYSSGTLYLVNMVDDNFQLEEFVILNVSDNKIIL